MKKMMILLAGLLVMSTAIARADNDKAVTIDQLPQTAQQFIQKYFPSEKVAYAKMERDFLETRYEVVFTSSRKVEFLKNGEWKEVDCRYSAVPEGIVPEQIMNKIKELYPEATVLEIDRDKYDYEVKLSNRMELTFDLRFNLIDMDD